jgi:hypothetical protein
MSKIRFEVCSHPKAPLFPSTEEGVKVFEELFSKLENGAELTSPEVIDIVRQAGYVNLWFFLKFIAGATGPFHFLNLGVHLDMCNFRQSETCMKEGAKVIVLLPRGFAKTTVFTEGAIAWELLRQPTLRARIVNATVTRAHQFKDVAQRVFDSNPFIAVLYPETVPKQGAKRWNATEMVMPNTTRLYKEASLSSGGVEGASEGDHFDLLQMDDIVGMDDVNADFVAGLSMDKAIVWFAMHETLLNSRTKSRSFVVATRYGPGDVYTKICENVANVFGYDNASFIKKPNGKWNVYYRHAVENGVATNPYVITAEQYQALLESDPLVAAYQYANDVTASIMNEFGQMKVKHCEIVWGEASQDFFIIREGDENERTKLSECQVCISCDWAGSEKRRSTRTSRTSIGVWAKDHANRCYRIDKEVGFFAIPDVFDKLFMLAKRWNGYFSATLLEANAMQKGIYDLITKEQQARNVQLKIRKKNAVGDKVVRIRTTVGLHLQKGLIYCTDKTRIEFDEERMSFPSAKLDVLDESEKALAFLSTPESDESKLQREYFRDENVAMAMDDNNEQAYDDENGFGY